MMMNRHGMPSYALPALVFGLLWVLSPTPGLSLTPPAPLSFELELTQPATQAQLITSAQQLAYRQLATAFQTDPQRQTVTVYVSVAHNGESVPLLAVTIDRPTWQQKPDLTAYTRYFKTAIALLNLPRSGSSDWTTASAPNTVTSSPSSPIPYASSADLAAREERLRQLQYEEMGHN